MPQKTWLFIILEKPSHLLLQNFWCYLRMDIHVLLQADSMAKAFPADLATKWPRPTVGPPDVDLKSVRRGEYLLFFVN